MTGDDAHSTTATKELSHLQTRTPTLPRHADPGHASRVCNRHSNSFATAGTVLFAVPDGRVQLAEDTGQQTAIRLTEPPR